MKYILTCILFFSMSKASELTIGSIMPELDHKMLGINGNSLSLSDVKGKKGSETMDKIDDICKLTNKIVLNALEKSKFSNSISIKEWPDSDTFPHLGNQAI